MASDPELKSLESRLLAVIQNRDNSISIALEKVNLRLEKHWERIKGVLERLRELEEMVTELNEKVEDLDSRKLDKLDDREFKSREETAVIFDQCLQEEEHLIASARDFTSEDGLDERLNLMVTRIAEIERIVRTQIR